MAAGIAGCLTLSPWPPNDQPSYATPPAPTPAAEAEASALLQQRFTEGYGPAVRAKQRPARTKANLRALDAHAHVKVKAFSAHRHRAARSGWTKPSWSKPPPQHRWQRRSWSAPPVRWDGQRRSQIKVTGSDRGSTALRYALRQVGSPYRFGGSGPGGFDCSGLAMAAYGRAGVRLPHQTGALMRRGRAIGKRQLRAGDLVFTDPGHVGVYLGRGRMVHAPQPGQRVSVARMWSFHSARRP